MLLQIRLQPGLGSTVGEECRKENTNRTMTWSLSIFKEIRMMFFLARRWASFDREE